MRLTESNTTLREGRGNPSECPRFAIQDEACRVSDVALNLGHENGIPKLLVIDYFSHSCLKKSKICLKRTLDATFLGCLVLTFCDVIGELLLE